MSKYGANLPTNNVIQALDWMVCHFRWEQGQLQECGEPQFSPQLQHAIDVLDKLKTGKWIAINNTKDVDEIVLNG